MGSLFSRFFAHIVGRVLVVGVCLLLVACEVSPPSMPTLPGVDEFLPQEAETAVLVDPDAIGGQPFNPGTEVEADPRYMEVRIHCEDVRRDDCGLLVTLHAIHDDVDLDLMLFGENGVQFLPNPDVLPYGQNDEATKIAHVKLRRGESRQIHFPYIPSKLDLPGAYKVIVLATEADTHNLHAYDNSKRVFVTFNEIGEFHLLPSGFEFNNHYRNQFTDGVLDMGYWIQFEGSERPHRGNLWLRVDSPIDGYQPRVEITGGDAIVFLDDRLWKPEVSNAGMTVSRNFPLMNAGGSRVAMFPFELDRNGRLLDGDYSFIVKQMASGITKTETMPLVVQLFSDPQYPNERWLGAHPIPPAVATSTPNATAVASDENYILEENVGFGGKYKNLSEAEANIECAKLANSQFNKENLPEPRWTRPIAMYKGTICQAYLNFVAGSVPLSWSEFEYLMVEYNEELNSTSDKLEEHLIYFLPQIDQ